MSLIIAVILILIVVAPLVLKHLEKLKLEKSEHQYEMLRKSVEDAVCYVHKVTENKEIEGRDKKSQAITLAKIIASKNGVSVEKQELIEHLIESILWKQESGEIVEEDDTY